MANRGGVFFKHQHVVCWWGVRRLGDQIGGQNLFDPVAAISLRYFTSFKAKTFVSVISFRQIDRHDGLIRTHHAGRRDNYQGTDRQLLPSTSLRNSNSVYYVGQSFLLPKWYTVLYPRCNLRLAINTIAIAVSTRRKFY
jgi:hypothetical protein